MIRKFLHTTSFCDGTRHIEHDDSTDKCTIIWGAKRIESVTLKLSDCLRFVETGIWKEEV